MKLLAREYDKFTGITEELWYEEVPDGNDKLHIRRLQDVDHLMAQNKIAYNSHTSKKPRYNDSIGIHKVAEVPVILIEKWMREGFNWYEASDAERKKKLNDPDYKKLKVRPGRL